MGIEPDQKPANPLRLSRHWFAAFAIILAVVIFGTAFLRSSSQQPQWSLTRVAKAAEDGQIARIEVTGTDTIKITLKDESTAYAQKDPSSSAIEQLRALGVSSDQLTAIDWSGGDNWDNIFVICMYLLPLVVVVGAIYWLLSRVVKYQPPEQKV